MAFADLVGDSGFVWFSQLPHFDPYGIANDLDQRIRINFSQGIWQRWQVGIFRSAIQGEEVVADPWMCRTSSARSLELGEVRRTVS